MNINQSHSIKSLPTESVPSEASAHCSLSVPPFLLGEIKAMKAEGKIKSISQFFTILCWDELRRLGRLSKKESANVSFTTSPPKSAIELSNHLDRRDFCPECLRKGHFSLAQDISVFHDCKTTISNGQCRCACISHGKRKTDPSKKGDRTPCGQEIDEFLSKGCRGRPAWYKGQCEHCSVFHGYQDDEDTQGAHLDPAKRIDPIDDIFTEGVDD